MHPSSDAYGEGVRGERVELGWVQFISLVEVVEVLIHVVVGQKRPER